MRHMLAARKWMGDQNQDGQKKIKKNNKDGDYEVMCKDVFNLILTT